MAQKTPDEINRPGSMNMAPIYSPVRGGRQYRRK